MDLEIIILSEVRERKISHDIAYMWNLKNKWYLQMVFLIYKREIVTDIKSKLTVTRAEKWPRVNWEIYIYIYILLCIK